VTARETDREIDISDPSADPLCRAWALRARNAPLESSFAWPFLDGVL
jgi:hypothetical protein